MFTVTYEEETGILLVSVNGTWTESDVERYGRAIRAAVLAAREETGSLRLLVDARNSEVPPHLAQPLLRTRNAVLQEDDRVAAVVSSSATKMAVRSAAPHPGSQLFISESAARTWLDAYEPQLRPAQAARL